MCIAWQDYNMAWNSQVLDETPTFGDWSSHIFLGVGHCSQCPHSNGTAQGRDGNQPWPGTSPTPSALFSICANMTAKYSTGAFPL